MTSAPAAPPPSDEVPGSDLSDRLARAQRRASAAQRGRLAAEQRAQEAEAAQADAESRLVEALTELELLRRSTPPPPTSPPSEDAVGSSVENGDDGAFALFNDPLTSQPSLAGDGSDPGVLPIALGGTALVGLMVVVLAAFNGKLFQPFGLAMVAITALLAYFAWQTRVERIEVQISQGGVVYVERSSSGALRFDLRSDNTEVTMSGEPGSQGWELTFRRGGVDSFTVNATMVDAEDFARRVRAFRPDL